MSNEELIVFYLSYIAGALKFLTLIGAAVLVFFVIKGLWYIFDRILFSRI